MTNETRPGESIVIGDDREYDETDAKPTTHTDNHINRRLHLLTDKPLFHRAGRPRARVEFGRPF